MFSEEDLSGSDKVYRAFPYIYVRVHVRVGLFSKMVKVENLAMLDRILPHEILYVTSSFQHNNTIKSP